MYDLNRCHQKFIWIIRLVVWIAALTIGMLAMISYSNTAGATGESPYDWPVDCAIQRATDRNTLLMFIHPRCPCSRASLRELARLLSQTGELVEAHVVFFQPAKERHNWSRTDLVEAATRIPKVNVILDVAAATASKFSVETSGHVLLYSREGRLLFSGGITSGRGHEGDNTGRSTVVSMANSNRQFPNTCPVFGCPIVDTNQPMPGR